jgi:hypothetical protein
VACPPYSANSAQPDNQRTGRHTRGSAVLLPKPGVVGSSPIVRSGSTKPNPALLQGLQHRWRYSSDPLTSAETRLIRDMTFPQLSRTDD